MFIDKNLFLSLTLLFLFSVQIKIFGKNVVEAFDLNTKTIKLNDGNFMPIIGLGTYSLKGQTCINSILSALENGYRLIDTAYIYDNEEAVGKAVKLSNIPREKIFITTKLYPNQYNEPEKAIESALKRLEIDYIDLMLLHHPGQNDVKAYKAMEKAKKDGKIKSIGLSCYYVNELDEFLKKIDIKPAVVQNEIHPYYQDKNVVSFIQKNGVVVESWYPLGGRGYTNKLLNDENILKIAKKHNKTPAQIILRWNLQRNIVIIPGSSNTQHIRENIKIFDFKLDDVDMKTIEKLDRNEKHDWY